MAGRTAWSSGSFKIALSNSATLLIDSVQEVLAHPQVWHCDMVFDA
jgi:hypothetical protein